MESTERAAISRAISELVYTMGNVPMRADSLDVLGAAVSELRQLLQVRCAECGRSVDGQLAHYCDSCHERRLAA